LADPGAITQAAPAAAADFGFGDGGISCVPFARAVSGIDVTGDAATWWDNAAGRYGRGAHPEPGGVLSFRAIDQMPLGHVAVVARILDSRRITVDHANWDNAGGVARGVAVMDVSPNNDWTQVRVALGDGGDFGAVYPTDGFIYKHPDGGAMVATADTVAAAPPPGPPRPALSAHPAAALPVVQSGPTGRGQIYLANSIFGVAGPNPGATPGAWLIAAARPRVVIASGGTRAR
jgi:surface antigen